jgi:P-type E1-E2 ATPase
LPTDVAELPGEGVSGRVEGHLVDVGSLAFARKRELVALETLSQAREDAGAADETVAVIGIDGRVAGLVIYADPPRPDARQLVRDLSTLGISETVMLTGDDSRTAAAIASEVGISTVKAELLPADKVAAVKNLLTQHNGVIMVGDGINDAPALASATVGIALGAHGAAVSAEAADIVILADDLARVGVAMEIGKHTVHIAKQSIFVGLGVSSLMMVVAAFGYIPPTLGALLQEVLDVGVIATALRAR